MIAKHERRLFLRGLGGAMVAAPFLSSVAERVAKGQAAPAPMPRRLIMMFTHHGCLTNRWFPVNSHGPLTADDLAGTSLEVLAPHVEKLLMPRGIRAMNEWTEDMSLGQGDDPWLQASASYFTCTPLSLKADNPRFSQLATGPSLDHVCAQYFDSPNGPLVLQLGGRDNTAQGTVSYSASEERFPGFDSATSAFGSLMGLFAEGEPVSRDSYLAMRRHSVVDLVKEDLDTLERHDMSGSDKRKLAAWKELLHETGSVVAAAQCNTELIATLGLTDENLRAFDNLELTGTDRLAGSVTSDMDGADLAANVAVLSAVCDPTRPILLKYPSAYIFSALGLETASHVIAARIGRVGFIGSCVEGVNDMILTIDRYYARKFAHLVRQLDGIEEGDGTVLDNSAAVWFQQFSDGAAVNLNNIPILQAGSCGGYFKTGYAVNVDGGAADLHRGNSEAPCAVDGRIDDIKQTGTPAEFANAPINKYYCNLMNAIGVQAGPDGFPALGGIEKVTHFGMYDNTRDFASGGMNPPSINDPGEFAELRSSS